MSAPEYDFLHFSVLGEQRPSYLRYPLSAFQGLAVEAGITDCDMSNVTFRSQVVCVVVYPLGVPLFLYLAMRSYQIPAMAISKRRAVGPSAVLMRKLQMTTTVFCGLCCAKICHSCSCKSGQTCSPKPGHSCCANQHVQEAYFFLGDGTSDKLSRQGT